MSDLIPISDEQAKLGTAAIEFVEHLGRYVARVLGDVPEDLVGVAGGDWLRVKRAENLVRMIHRAEERLKARGISEPKHAALSIGLPLLEAAANENRDELVELWARLLAAAMDPSRAGSMRAAFVESLKNFDPIDALVFSGLDRGLSEEVKPNLRDFFASKLGLTPDQVELSLIHLYDIGVAWQPGVARMMHADAITSVSLTPLGRELRRSLDD